MQGYMRGSQGTPGYRKAQADGAPRGHKNAVCIIAAKQKKKHVCNPTTRHTCFSKKGFCREQKLKQFMLIIAKIAAKVKFKAPSGGY